MTITPEVLDGELSLSAAANRLSYLSRKDAEATSRPEVAGPPVEDAPPAVWADIHAQDTSLDTEEALELLALGEAISRKAHEHDAAAVLAARRAGADWADIALAQGLEPAAAWDQYRDAFDDDELRGARPA